LRASDYYQLAAIKALNQPPGPRESQHNKRLRRVLAGETHVLPWEGVTWVLDLLWVEPRETITVLNAYLITHILELPDGRIHGISDSIEIIRAYYLGLPDSPEETLKLLLSLSSRDMEHLVDDLFHESGYKTELTPARKDGGRDIVARKKESGHQIRIYIEVKNWSRPVGVKEVRALNGVIESESIEKGILVGTSGFTKGEKSATEFASNVPRIDLMGGKELIELLSQTYGREWPKSIDTYIRHSKQRLVKVS
jgi:restriction system protein